MNGAGIDDFMLALQTGMTLDEIGAMRNVDHQAWRDFLAVRRAWGQVGKGFG